MAKTYAMLARWHEGMFRRTKEERHKSLAEYYWKLVWKLDNSDED